MKQAAVRNPWQLAGTAFGSGKTEFLRILLKRLELNESRMSLPQSARSRVASFFGQPDRMKVELAYHEARMGQYELRMTIGEDVTPWLDPQALEIYLCIEYPDLFRLRPQ